VVIAREKPQDMTPGGIVIPDRAQEKKPEGLVIAVGPGRHDDSGMLVPMTVKKGDRVLFGKYSGAEIDLDETTSLIVMREEDIFAILTE
jgi:chaperonin GroES